MWWICIIGRLGIHLRGSMKSNLLTSHNLATPRSHVNLTLQRSPAFVTRLMNDSSSGSPATQATFYIHFYHHGAIDITRIGNERITLN